MTTIGFLHTSPVHVLTFDDLVSELDPDGTTRVVSDVRVELLERARRRGVDDPMVVDEVRSAVGGLGACDVVVCTCSTLGGLAEEVGRESGIRVVRVDRPMVDEAVRLAAVGPGRIAVVAAVESTVTPTASLVESVIESSGVQASVDVHLVRGAWERFEAGDRIGYLDLIAAAVTSLAGDADVVLLAQASMADVAARVAVDVPVLSSPRLAVASLLN